MSVRVCVSVSWGYFGLTSSYSAGGPAPPPTVLTGSVLSSALEASVIPHGGYRGPFSGR